MYVELGQAKFQRSNAKETLSSWQMNGGGRKNVRFFKRKTSHISEMVKDMTKVTIDH